MTSDGMITSYEKALELLKNYLLVSKAYGAKPSVYAYSKDDHILVINQNSKYYITKEKFKEFFSLAPFYIYKSLDEVEIDQEFRTLRQ